MATIKSYTDLEQSHKLAEILPLGSADMWWAWYSSPLSEAHYGDSPMFYKPICNPNESVPCWSLASLLDVLPEKYTELIKEGGMYRIIIKDSYITCLFDNPIDACVAMIERLHELNLL